MKTTNIGLCIVSYALVFFMINSASAKNFDYPFPEIKMPTSKWKKLNDLAVSDGTINTPPCYSKIVIKNMAFNNIYGKHFISIFSTIWAHNTTTGNYLCETKMSGYRIGTDYKTSSLNMNLEFETFSKNGKRYVIYDDDVFSNLVFPLNMKAKIPALPISKDNASKAVGNSNSTKLHGLAALRAAVKEIRNSNSTKLDLSAAELNAIANAVRPCWGIDAGAPGVQDFSVLLQVTTDASGVVREAEVAPADQGKLGDPVFAAFAQRAVSAAKNYKCAKLPLPPYMLGTVHTFTFRFNP